MYNHKTILQRWHVNNTQRLGPIIAVADINYAFQDMAETAEFYKKTYKIPSMKDSLFVREVFKQLFLLSFCAVTPTTKYGNHGYDNEEKSMHAIFIAIGPLFAQSKTLKPFNTVDLYNLFCVILKLKCAENKGSDGKDSWQSALLLDSTTTTDANRKPGKLQYITNLIRDRFNFRVFKYPRN